MAVITDPPYYSYPSWPWPAIVYKYQPPDTSDTYMMRGPDTIKVKVRINLPIVRVPAMRAEEV